MCLNCYFEVHFREYLCTAVLRYIFADSSESVHPLFSAAAFHETTNKHPRLQSCHTLAFPYTWYKMSSDCFKVEEHVQLLSLSLVQFLHSLSLRLLLLLLNKPYLLQLQYAPPYSDFGLPLNWTSCSTASGLPSISTSHRHWPFYGCNFPRKPVIWCWIFLQYPLWERHERSQSVCPSHSFQISSENRRQCIHIRSRLSTSGDDWYLCDRYHKDVGGLFNPSYRSAGKYTRRCQASGHDLAFWRWFYQRDDLWRDLWPYRPVENGTSKWLASHLCCSQVSPHCVIHALRYPFKSFLFRI